MATIKQVNANRQNAKKSTGPRTPEGKRRVSQNAIKHGLSASEVVLPGEDAAEFERMRDGFVETLEPAGLTPEHRRPRAHRSRCRCARC